MTLSHKNNFRDYIIITFNNKNGLLILIRHYFDN